jgi:fanconi anemia group D2 protein
MVFLQRNRPVNPRKRPPPAPPDSPDAIDAAAALLADAGCTLLVPPHQAPSLPSPHSFAARLARSLGVGGALPGRLLAGLAAFAAASPARLRQLLLPAAAPHAPSLARALLAVPALQPGLLALLLDKLPEHFDAPDGLPLQDDVARLIVAQFRWLDFLVDADAFVDKLVEVMSVAPPRLKKEIIGSLPEIVGDQRHATVVSALEKLLQEDSEVVVAVLDALSDLNLNETLQDQVTRYFIYFYRTLFCK